MVEYKITISLEKIKADSTEISKENKNRKERNRILIDVLHFGQDYGKMKVLHHTRKWVHTIAQKIKFEIVEIRINEEGFDNSIKNRKNCSASGIDRIQNCCWKKFAAVKKSVVKCMNESTKEP